MLYEAAYDTKKADAFVVYLTQVFDDKNSILVGYTGMSHLLLAKHGYNPYTQLKEFYKGRDLLEKAIKMDNNNIELRFLRLTVQSNAPFFLNYSGKIDDDKELISKNYTKLEDVDLGSRIKSFFTRRKYML